MIQPVLALVCGSIVGFTLAVIGGGGSILATPLLLYVVGLQPHVAVGTSALAVSVNAFANFGGYARQGIVRWRCAILFSIVGMAADFCGSLIGRDLNGQHLLFLFAILMIAVGVLMLRRKGRTPQQHEDGSRVCELWRPASEINGRCFSRLWP